MKTMIHQAISLGSRLRARALRYARSHRGNVAAIIAISLVPLAGVMGMAAEGSNWFLQQRSQQNAADTAVVAAATTALSDYYNACASGGCTWSSTKYQSEGSAVAAKYGYTTNGTNPVVTVSTTACPNNVTVTGIDCFQVTITKPQPLYLSHLVGFSGNTTLNGGPALNITASAIAGPVIEPSNICLLALGWGSMPGSYALDFKGSSGVDLNGCPVGTNNGMDCTGHSTLDSPYGVAGDSSTIKKGCGNLSYGESGGIADPYSHLATSLSQSPYNNTCSSYDTGTTDATNYNTINSVGFGSGSQGSPQVNIICGNLNLPAGGTVKVTGTQVWVIENGVLNLQGATLETDTNGGLAIVFTSPNYAGVPSSVKTGSVGYIQDSSTGGFINISSPLAGNGPFSGVTFYQDPTPWNTCNCSTFTGTNDTYSATWDGNSEKLGWSISGIVYFPNGNFTLNGATDKASNGYNCFDMVINSITSHGGNSFSMFANPLSECGEQGSNLPQVYGFRFALVG